MTTGRAKGKKVSSRYLLDVIDLPWLGLTKHVDIEVDPAVFLQGSQTDDLCTRKTGQSETPTDRDWDDELLTSDLCAKWESFFP